MSTSGKLCTKFYFESHATRVLVIYHFEGMYFEFDSCRHLVLFTAFYK